MLLSLLIYTAGYPSLQFLRVIQVLTFLWIRLIQVLTFLWLIQILTFLRLSKCNVHCILCICPVICLTLLPAARTRAAAPRRVLHDASTSVSPWWRHRGSIVFHRGTVQDRGRPVAHRVLDSRTAPHQPNIRLVCRRLYRGRLQWQSTPRGYPQTCHQ